MLVMGARCGIYSILFILCTLLLEETLSEFHRNNSQIGHIYSIKSTENLKILLLGVCELEDVLTRFHLFLAQEHIINGKIFALNFNNKSHRLTNIFLKKSTMSTYSASWGLKIYLPTWTIFRREILYLEDTISAKFYSNIFIGSRFIYCKVKESVEV